VGLIVAGNVENVPQWNAPGLKGNAGLKFALK